MDNANRSIAVNVKLCRDDVIEMNLVDMKALNIKHRKGRTASLILAVLILLILIIMWIAAFISGGSLTNDSLLGIRLVAISPALILTMVFLALFMVYHYGIPLIVRGFWNKHFDNDPDLQKEIRYEISSDGIKVQSEGGTESWKFHDIYKIMETEKHLFIFESSSSAGIIPKHCFLKAEEISAAVSLLKEKISPKKYEYINS